MSNFSFPHNDFFPIREISFNLIILLIASANSFKLGQFKMCRLVKRHFRLRSTLYEIKDFVSIKRKFEYHTMTVLVASLACLTLYQIKRDFTSLLQTTLVINVVNGEIARLDQVFLFHQ